MTQLYIPNIPAESFIFPHILSVMFFIMIFINIIRFSCFQFLFLLFTPYWYLNFNFGNWTLGDTGVPFESLGLWFGIFYGLALGKQFFKVRNPRNKTFNKYRYFTVINDFTSSSSWCLGKLIYDHYVSIWIFSSCEAVESLSCRFQIWLLRTEKYVWFSAMFKSENYSLHIGV